jgi:hypothetical protein
MSSWIDQESSVRESAGYFEKCIGSDDRRERFWPDLNEGQARGV